MLGDVIFKERIISTYTKSSWKTGAFLQAKLHFWTWTRLNLGKSVYGDGSYPTPAAVGLHRR
mgnify:CR=1 FL=1